MSTNRIDPVIGVLTIDWTTVAGTSPVAGASPGTPPGIAYDAVADYHSNTAAIAAVGTTGVI